MEQSIGLYVVNDRAEKQGGVEERETINSIMCELISSSPRKSGPVRCGCPSLSCSPVNC